MSEYAGGWCHHGVRAPEICRECHPGMVSEKMKEAERPSIEKAATPFLYRAFKYAYDFLRRSGHGTALIDSGLRKADGKADI